QWAGQWAGQWDGRWRAAGARACRLPRRAADLRPRVGTGDAGGGGGPGARAGPRRTHPRRGGGPDQARRGGRGRWRPLPSPASPVVPLVSDLRAAAGPAGVHVHLGATSQDILDTAAMLVARDAVAVVLADLGDAAESLAGLAERHRDTVMAARTLGQQAVPTTFGLKAATWLTGVLRARDRLAALRLPAQLGGAAGTLSALTERLAAGHGGASDALLIVTLFAEETGLADPGIPWHAERSVIAD